MSPVSRRKEGRITRIVAFGPEHIPEAVPLFRDVFGAEPWDELWTEEDALARIRDVRSFPGARGWAATRRHLVGFALGSEVLSIDGDRQAFLLQEMAVHRHHQCQGIGTRLLRALEEEVARAGIEVVEVLTVAGKWPCYFYEKNGYERCAELEHNQVILGRAL